MAAENFNTYTETDPNGRITRTSSRITWADLTISETAFVYLDKGVGFFSDSFVHRIHTNISAADASSSSMGTVWMVTNTVDTFDDQTDDLHLVFRRSGATPQFILQEFIASSATSSATFTATLGVDYFIQITRDETAGANGDLTAAIFLNAQFSGTPEATLTVTLGSKVDFRYIFGLSSRDAGGPTNKFSGFVENLDITNNAGTPQVSTQLPTAITATTATGNGTIADLGISSVTAHGWVWDTSAIDTAVVPGSQPNSTDEGAGSLGPFTTAITGLTGGIIYFARAYATNTQGTTYGEGVQWKAGATYSTKEWGEISMKGNELHTVGEDGVERAHMGTPV